MKKLPEEAALETFRAHESERNFFRDRWLEQMERAARAEGERDAYKALVESLMRSKA